jgi:hypothetical protein
MSAEKGSKRQRQEETAISAPLTEPTIEAVAATVGVNESTLRRWLAEPEFKAKYRTARRQVVESAVSRLQSVATKAVDALERSLSCGIPAVEVGPAKSVLDQVIKAVELMDLGERLEALEAASEQAAAREKGGRR